MAGSEADAVAEVRPAADVGGPGSSPDSQQDLGGQTVPSLVGGPGRILSDHALGKVKVSHRAGISEQASLAL